MVLFFGGFRFLHYKSTVCRKRLRFATSRETIYDSVMATRGVGFESSSSIEERKDSKRHARQEALEKVWPVRFVANSPRQ